MVLTLMVMLLVAAKVAASTDAFDIGDTKGKLPVQIGKQLLSAATTTPQGWWWQ